MSDSNRVAVRTVREVTRGLTPATPAFQEKRHVTFAPSTGISTVESAEKRADRRQSDVSLVGVDPAPSLNGELSAFTYDDDIEAAMMALWVRTPVKSNKLVAGNITSVSATSYSTTAAGGAPLTGSIMSAAGFTNAANNKVFVAGAATSSTSTVHTGGVTEAAPPLTARLKVVGFEGVAGDIKAVTVGGSGLTATAGNFVNMGLVVGQWVFVGGKQTANGFATAGVGGWCRVSAVTAGVLSFDMVPAGWAADTGTGKNIRIYFGDYVREGITQISQTIEAEQTDAALFHYFRGSVTDTMAINVVQKQIATIAFGYQSMQYDPTGTRIVGATTLPPTVTPVLNGAANVGRIAENGVAITATANLVMEFAISVNNNVRRKGALGYIGAADMGLGESRTEGSFNSYFGDITVLSRILTNTASSVSVPLLDIDGNGYMIDVPQLKYTGGDPEFGAKNTDTTIQPGFRALIHPVLGYQLHIQRMEAVGF